MGIITMWLLVGLATAVLATRRPQILAYFLLGPLALLWHFRRLAGKRDSGQFRASR